MAMDHVELGGLLQNAVIGVDVNQDSVANGDVGRARMNALAKTIIDYISTNATIGALTVVGGGGGTTAVATGKIS